MFNHRIKADTRCKECGAFYAAHILSWTSSGGGKRSDEGTTLCSSYADSERQKRLQERYVRYKQEGNSDMLELLEDLCPSLAKASNSKVLSPYQSMQQKGQASMAAQRTLDQVLDKIASLTVALTEAKEAATKAMVDAQAAETAYADSRKAYNAATAGVDGPVLITSEEQPKVTVLEAIEAEYASLEPGDPLAEAAFKVREQAKLVAIEIEKRKQQKEKEKEKAETEAKRQRVDVAAADVDV